MNARTETTQVLIAGAGPAGSVAAALEIWRRDSVAPAARAIFGSEIKRIERQGMVTEACLLKDAQEDASLRGLPLRHATSSVKGGLISRGEATTLAENTKIDTGVFAIPAGVMIASGLLTLTMLYGAISPSAASRAARSTSRACPPPIPPR